MNRIQLEAYAKINLTLNVLARRQDGYHEIETVFHRVSLSDTVTVSRISGVSFTLSCDLPGLRPEDNLVTKAFFTLKRKFPQIDGVHVEIKKRIPTQAGLGGGSADCAAFLLAANQLFELYLSAQELCAIGAALGADVPACLYASPMVGRGIGEILEPVETRDELQLVIIKPSVAFSTAQMYQKIDHNQNGIPEPRNTDAVCSALKQGDLDTVCACLYNSFEMVCTNRSIGLVKAALIAAGARGAMMSGSGSAVFGIFEDAPTAEKAYRQLNGRHEAYLCTGIREGRYYF